MTKLEVYNKVVAAGSNEKRMELLNELAQGTYEELYDASMKDEVLLEAIVIRIGVECSIQAGHSEEETLRKLKEHADFRYTISPDES